MASVKLKIVGTNNDRIIDRKGDGMYVFEINMDPNKKGSDDWGKKIVDVLNGGGAGIDSNKAWKFNNVGINKDEEVYLD